MKWNPSNVTCLLDTVLVRGLGRSKHIKEVTFSATFQWATVPTLIHPLFFQILKNPEADIFVTQWEGKSCLSGTSKNFPATVSNSVSNLFSVSVSVSASVSLRAEPIFFENSNLIYHGRRRKNFFASDLKNFVSKIELTIFNSSLWSLSPQFFSGEEEEDWNHEVDSFQGDWVRN